MTVRLCDKCQKRITNVPHIRIRASRVNANGMVEEKGCYDLCEDCFQNFVKSLCIKEVDIEE